MIWHRTVKQQLPGYWPGTTCWWPLLLASLMLCASVQAQSGGIAYVDMRTLLDQAPQVVSARDALDREFRPRNEALLADESRLDRLRQRQDNTSDRDEMMALEREIRNLQRSIERRREDLSEELRFRTNAEKKALEESIEVAIRQVAEDNDLLLVVTSPVAYAAPSIDITDQVLDWLERDFEAPR
ncbi:MAG: OmpH family outer membrane protein [Wenzhouxiangella sp.]